MSLSCFSSMLLAVKMALPILAAGTAGEVGNGGLMKAIPQINAFVINMELKVIIGLILFFLLLTPINEFLLGLESGMLSGLRRGLDDGRRLSRGALEVRRLWGRQTDKNGKSHTKKAA